MDTQKTQEHAREIPFELPHDASFGGVIRGVVETPRQPGERPTVVICHGFKGFFEWGFFPPLAELLVERGYSVVRFNFSGSGMQPGDERVTDLDAFRRNTFSLERDETLAVLDAAPDLAAGRIDGERMALLGHSRGGGAAILAAAEKPWRDLLRALVTWSSISTFDRYRQQEETWRREGVLTIQNGRTGQELPLGLELLEDLEENGDALSLEDAAARRKAPWLIVHGEDDETVPVAEARALASWAGETTDDEDEDDLDHRFEIIDGAGHTFGAQHPFAGPTPELIQAMNATQIWLRRHCW